MRIGVDGTWLPTDRRGMGRYVRNILACWGEPAPVLLARRRNQVRWLREAYPEAECHPFSAAPPLDVCWFPWNRIDHDPGCPRVVTLHDLAPFHTFDPATRPHPGDQARFRQAAEEADSVIAVTRAMRGEILERFGLDPSRVTVIPEGIDPAFLGTGREDPPERPFVLAVGAVEPRKNLLRLLDAFPEVYRRTGRILRVAGSLPSRPAGLSAALARLARRPDPLWDRLDALGEAVALERNPDDRLLARLYRTCDAFVFPTLYEGFGLPLLEALASGAPVAASRIPPLVEIGGDLPEWFDPEDPSDIARGVVRAVEGGRRATGEERRRLVEEYRWETVARSVRTWLEEVAGR